MAGKSQRTPDEKLQSEIRDILRDKLAVMVKWYGPNEVKFKGPFRDNPFFHDIARVTLALEWYYHNLNDNVASDIADRLATETDSLYWLKNHGPEASECCDRVLSEFGSAESHANLLERAKQMYYTDFAQKVVSAIRKEAEEALEATSNAE